jgi:hypothetical protein
MKNQDYSVRFITDTLIKMELDLNLFEDSTYGSKARLAWEASRFNIQAHLFEQFVGHRRPQKPKEISSIKGFHFIISLLFNITIKSWLFAPKNKEWLVLQHPRLKINDNGIYEDIYSDDIISNIGSAKCCIIARSYNRRYYSPQKYKVWYNDIYHLIVFIFKRMPFFHIKHYSKIVIMVEDINNYLSIVFAQKINIGSIIKDSFIPIIIGKQIYRFMLKYLKPKQILLSVSYGKEDIITVARNLNIPTIEIMHGMLDDVYLSYLIPNGKIKKSFPDYIWIWGEYWKRDIAWLSGDRIKILGFPYFNREYIKYARNNKLKQVLFLSQGTIGADLSMFAVKIASQLQGQIPVIYKLHPGEYNRWKDAYPWLLEAANNNLIRVIDRDVNPYLYELLSTSQWVIAVYSTTIFEALAFGSTVMLLNLPSKLERLIDEGITAKLNITDDFNPEMDLKKYDSDIFFVQNWKERLDRILNEEIRCY